MIGDDLIDNSLLAATPKTYVSSRHSICYISFATTVYASYSILHPLVAVEDSVRT